MKREDIARAAELMELLRDARACREDVAETREPFSIRYHGRGDDIFHDSEIDVTEDRQELLRNLALAEVNAHIAALETELRVLGVTS